MVKLFKGKRAKPARCGIGFNHNSHELYLALGLSKEQNEHVLRSVVGWLLLDVHLSRAFEKISELPHANERLYAAFILGKIIESGSGMQIGIETGKSGNLSQGYIG